MRKISLLFCLFALFPFGCCSQSGFSNTYDFGGRAAGFVNCILVGDTIVISGDILPAGSNQWSAMLARMDTNGQVIDVHYYPDTLGDHFVQVPNYDIIKNSQNEYLMLGTLYERNSGVLIKTDVNGNLKFYKEYPPNNDFTYRPRKTIELPDGYLMIGYKSRPNYHLDAHMMKVNKDGDVQWEKYLGAWELDETGSSLVMLDSNRFMVGGFSGIGNVPSAFDAYTRSKFWVIDSLGNSQ